jgi:transcriptional regulator with XRE-family HTH domain
MDNAINDPADDFRTVLTKARGEAWLTPEWAAEVLDVTLSTYEEWERGLSVPPEHVKNQVLETLQKKKDDLIPERLKNRPPAEIIDISDVGNETIILVGFNTDDDVTNRELRVYKIAPGRVKDIEGKDGLLDVGLLMQNFTPLDVGIKRQPRTPAYHIPFNLFTDELNAIAEETSVAITDDKGNIKAPSNSEMYQRYHQTYSFLEGGENYRVLIAAWYEQNYDPENCAPGQKWFAENVLPIYNNDLTWHEELPLFQQPRAVRTALGI